MKLTKCDQGHFYDGDLYDTCPHCGFLPPAKEIIPTRIMPAGIHAPSEGKDESSCGKKVRIFPAITRQAKKNEPAEEPKRVVRSASANVIKADSDEDQAHPVDHADALRSPDAEPESVTRIIFDPIPDQDAASWTEPDSFDIEEMDYDGSLIFDDLDEPDDELVSGQIFPDDNSWELLPDQPDDGTETNVYPDVYDEESMAENEGQREEPESDPDKEERSFQIRCDLVPEVYRTQPENHPDNDSESVSEYAEPDNVVAEPQDWNESEKPELCDELLNLPVGWLVRLGDENRGRELLLCGGRNLFCADEVVRSKEQPDLTENEECRALVSIEYDAESCEFWLETESEQVECRINGRPAGGSCRICSKDMIEIDDRLFVFVALCGNDFNW